MVLKLTKPLWCGATLAVSIAYVALCAYWSFGIPYNGAPDEYTHFFLIDYIYQFGEVPAPKLDPAEPFVGPLSGDTLTNNIFWYYGLPYVHSLGAVGFAKIFAPLFSDGDGYMAARMFNWFMGGLFIYSQMQISRVVLGGPSLVALMAGTITAIIPQVTFVFSYMNSDGFGLMSLSLMCWSLSVLLRFERTKDYILMGASIGLVVLTKIYYYPAIIFVLMLLFYKWFFIDGSLKYRDICIGIISCAIVCAPIIFMTVLNFGEFLGVSGQFDFVEIHKNNPATRYGTCYILCQDQLIDVENLKYWLVLTWRSFFGVFGWMNKPFDSMIYVLVFLPISALFICSSGLAFYRAIIKGVYIDAFAIILYWLMVVGTIITSILSSQTTFPQPQGRYIFVAVPVATFIIALILRNVEAKKVIDA